MTVGGVYGGVIKPWCRLALGGAEFPDGQGGAPLAHVNTGGRVLIFNEASKETADEGITT